MMDPDRIFGRLVAGTVDLIATRNAPGFIIGLSGTDSILAFLICARAFELVHRPSRVLGVHFRSHTSPSWFQHQIVPWLHTQVSSAAVEIDTSINAASDGARWGALCDRSTLVPELGCLLPAGGNYWIVNPVNRTELILGTYSNASRCASFHPIERLWKSEVLQLCEWLGVPDIAISMSRQTDEICGRCQLLAHNIEEIDEILMRLCGDTNPDPADGYPDNVILLRSFVESQMKTAAFKNEIPYKLEY